MKKGYKRLLIFEIFVFLVLILNSFAENILSGYKMIIFLLILLGIFIIFFGFERDKHRYIKDIILETIIYLFIFFIIFYLLGIFISFARVEGYYTWYGLRVFVIQIILTIILREILRYMVMCKSEGSKSLVILTCIMFIFIDISTTIYYTNFSTKYSSFLFIALTLLPSISNNIVFSVITLKVGYKPIILYSLVIGLYRYLFPIIPNPDEYLTSIIMFLVPVFYGYRIYRFYDKVKDKQLERDYNKKRYGYLLIPSFMIIILVYFTSGYFHYHAIAVASGSMTPSILKGDIVVTEKIDGDFSKLKKGQVIAYKYDNIVIVHRLINIIEEKGTYYFYSKGDANDEEDNWVINEDMIIGVVNVKIPYLGLPTVWLNEL